MWVDFSICCDWCITRYFSFKFTFYYLYCKIILIFQRRRCRDQMGYRFNLSVLYFQATTDMLVMNFCEINSVRIRSSHAFQEYIFLCNMIPWQLALLRNLKFIDATLRSICWCSIRKRLTAQKWNIPSSLHMHSKFCTVSHNILWSMHTNMLVPLRIMNQGVCMLCCLATNLSSNEGIFRAAKQHIK